MSALRRDDGFTLVELLVAMVLALVVFGASLTLLDSYLRQSGAAAKRLDAQDQARLAVDRIVHDLRNVSSPLTTPKLLERATPYDVVFQTIGTPSGTNVSGIERVRYCVPQDSTTGTASQEVLVAQTQTWTTSTPSADPWISDPSQTIACPDLTFTPASGQAVYAVIAQSIMNRYQQTSSYPAFSFNDGLDSNSVAATDLPQISTIQINLRVNPTPSLSGATTQVQSAAYLRNKQHSPVAQFTYTATGGGGVILNAGQSYSPDNEQLSYAWACTSSPCPSASALSIASNGLVSWRPGAGTYTVALTVTDQTGVQTTTTQQVTVT
ncbi:MAG TPA: prepilin-type N-terminal cleavage/methylation domain-containing protein [Conexibacter sp.]|nr:prepilin-type N-terminal cleavage/methylation domain-containing protein [Conexibacter sp.]